MTGGLFTREGKALYEDRKKIPWEVHPRPLLKRDDFINLNGFWKFRVIKDDRTIRAGEGQIRVPFPPESPLSGVGRHFPEGAELIYERKVTLPPGFRKDILLLHLDGVDQHAKVYIDGEFAGSHDGGYEHFTLDISSAKDEFTLRVIAVDDLNDSKEPYGKQRLKRGGMWYTPFSGIWQPVWIESVPEEYVRELRIETDTKRALIETDKRISGELLVEMPDGRKSYPLKDGRAEIYPENPRLWSPEDPWLYHFKLITDGGDQLSSYFALRSITCGRDETGTNRLFLNGRPYFFHGLLDQGYFPDGLSTPADPALYERDILAAKELGFNMLRKHVRVDPDLYYAACDRLGIVVFQDIVNNGRYSFLHDTALPNLGFFYYSDLNRYPDVPTRKTFVKRMEETVRQLYSFPSILYWTIFNEGWGQFDSASVSLRLKEMDDTRIIDAASGWFDQGAGDVASVHIYGHSYIHARHVWKKKPVVLSECGGYTCALKEHMFNPEKAYGYGVMKSSEEFLKRIERLYNEEIKPVIKLGLSGAVYTQLSDVEDETNGLITYDREVVKVDSVRMRKLMEGVW